MALAKAKLSAVAVLLVASVLRIKRGDASKADIKVITESAATEKWLFKYKDVIGEPDFERYRGHVYRVLNIALHLLKENPRVEQLRETIEIALVFHDIALWTTRELSYVVPSNKLALETVTGQTEEQKALMSNIILYHHKITPFKGENADIVSAVIAADLADFTFGLVRSGFSSDNMAKLLAEIPDTGFHTTLNLRIPAIRGWNIFRGVWEVMQIFYW
ncbi:unnamed protein product [Prorocentrum cordatum]|uniref:HD domain-containing protein n=1 Tax=Prorocentrum cordatum TaxID=2364126 RepID=A0ABN9PEF9_9DINO|nr:unnamed protein product [Polarella glacialis]